MFVTVLVLLLIINFRNNASQQKKLK